MSSQANITKGDLSEDALLTKSALHVGAALIKIKIKKISKIKI